MDRPIRSVGVVGAGTMGAGIAQLALEAGHAVRLYDLDAEAVAAARARIGDGLARRAARLDLDADAIDDWVAGRLAGLTAATDLADLASRCDLVIEAAIEDLPTKQGLFRELDEAAGPETILATNTSALSVSAIATATERPERVAGLHFFNPAPLMRLIEVVSTASTDPGVISDLVALMERWDRTPVRCADSPGFIVNRVNRPFTLEPLAALDANEASAPAIDAAARAAGYPMGPFELIDLIGLDVNLAVSAAIYDAAVAAGDPLAERFRPSTLQARLVADGRFGRKRGGGFRAPEDDAGRPSAAQDETAAAIVERTELAIIDEAYRALGEGVADAADIDLALRLGAGHSLGPFERAGQLGGPGAALARLTALADRGPRFVPAPALVAAATGASATT